MAGDGSSISSKNAGKLLADYTASHPRIGVRISDARVDRVRFELHVNLGFLLGQYDEVSWRSPTSNLNQFSSLLTHSLMELSPS
jgi:hypothetical protein